jgi:hypothetical protein
MELQKHKRAACWHGNCHGAEQQKLKLNSVGLGCVVHPGSVLQALGKQPYRYILQSYNPNLDRKNSSL